MNFSLSFARGIIKALYILVNTSVEMVAIIAPIPNVIAKPLITPLVNANNNNAKISAITFTLIVGIKDSLNAFERAAFAVFSLLTNSSLTRYASITIPIALSTIEDITPTTPPKLRTIPGTPISNQPSASMKSKLASAVITPNPL